MRYALFAVSCLLLLGFVAGLAFFRGQRGPSIESASEAHHELPPPAQGEPSEKAIRVHFSDLTDRAGIHFTHVDGRTPMSYFPEVMGGGVAWLDYDQDGLMDLLLVQSGSFPPDPKRPPAGPTSRLYRNLGDGTFMDVTQAVGIRHGGYGQGVAVGDYDNDGFPDIFVSCFGGGYLFHNEPDGKGGRRFRDVTKRAGISLDG